jgi:hypothetical protein
VPLSILRGRVQQPGEPLFLPDDTEVALQARIEEEATCRCGHPKDITMDPAVEGKFEVSELFCDACAALAEHQRETSKGDLSEDRFDGVYFVSDLPAG